MIAVPFGYFQFAERMMKSESPGAPSWMIGVPRMRDDPAGGPAELHHVGGGEIGEKRQLPDEFLKDFNSAVELVAALRLPARRTLREHGAAQMLVHELHRHRALAHRRSDALGRTMPEIARDKDAGDACLEPEGIAVERAIPRPLAGLAFEVEAGQNKALRIDLQRRRSAIRYAARRR